MKDVDGLVNLAFVVKNTCAKYFDQWMFWLDLRALIKLANRLFILALIHEDPCAIVTCQHLFTWIQPYHTIETAQRLFVIAVEPCDHASHKLHTRIVRIFVAQRIDCLARLLLLSTGEVDEHHVHARFEQARVECQSFSKSVLGLVVIARLAQALQHAIDVTTSNSGVSEREV